jgi:hypothetical protein
MSVTTMVTGVWRIVGSAFVRLIVPVYVPGASREYGEFVGSTEMVKETGVVNLPDVTCSQACDEPPYVTVGVNTIAAPVLDIDTA